MTSCPHHTGEDCQVLEPRSGHLFDLSSLKGRDYPVQSGDYSYHLSVCGGLHRGICTHKDTGNDRVASCQVKGEVQRIAGERSTATSGRPCPPLMAAPLCAGTRTRTRTYVRMCVCVCVCLHTTYVRTYVRTSFEQAFS